LFLASAFAILGANVAWAYGGTIGANEYVGPGRTATDYKNPLPIRGQPNHYHVTVCNDGNWYGVWYPPEWRDNDGRVNGTPKGQNQHGHAKEEDGTGGGVQIMGNGRGGDDIEITLRKEKGATVYLRIRVIDCSHLRGQRGLLASTVPLWLSPAEDTAFPLSDFPPELRANNRHFRAEIGRMSVFPFPPGRDDRPRPPVAPGEHLVPPERNFVLPHYTCMGVRCAMNSATTIQPQQKEVR